MRRAGKGNKANRRDGEPEGTEECRRLKEQLLDLQQLGRIGIWEYDYRTGFASFSPFMRGLHSLGPGDGELGIEEVLATIRADDRERMRALFEPSGETAEYFEFDYRTGTNGDTQLLHARAHVEHEGGKPVRIVGTSQDVTEERRLEGVRERAFLASIVESSSDAIVTKSLDGTITSWNKAAESLFGYGADEIVGKSVTMLFPPDRLAEEADIIRRVSRGERIEPFETQRMRKDGKAIDVSVAISPLRDRDGRIIGASKVARDITLRKREQEREMAAIDAELRRLDEMSRFRARFLNVAAHELKTPLTPIRLQLQLLSMQLKDQPEAMQRSLAILNRSVERLRLLMDDVLDAARVQATHLKLRRQPMDVGGVVFEAMETYAQVAKKMNVQLQLDLPAPVTVDGDHTRLLQVVNNILSNALKFTPPGGWVRVALHAAGKDSVLTVRDSGRGLTADQRRQLFQPFMQVHPDLEATSKGSGLGLYIVKAIVEQHGGTIDLESEGPDKGTKVTVRLPLAENQPTTQPPSPRERPSRQNRRPSRELPAKGPTLP